MNVQNEAAHEANIDAAYRALDARAAQGENMDNAYVDETTYEIKFKGSSIITVFDVKEGAELGAPVYVEKPYIVLGKTERVVLMAGSLAEIKAAWAYYDDCPVEVRQHDLYLNNNKKVAA